MHSICSIVEYIKSVYSINKNYIHVQYSAFHIQIVVHVRMLSTVTHTCVFTTIHVLSYFFEDQVIGLRNYVFI